MRLVPGSASGAGSRRAPRSISISASRTSFATAGFTRPPLLDFFMSRYTAAYAAEIAAFVAALKQGSAPPTTGTDALMALALADAAMRSVTEGHVVRLSEILA